MSLLKTLVRWLAVAAGWVAFAYGWFLVAQDPSPGLLGAVGGRLGLILLALALLTAYWIVHNVRIAREGRRADSCLWAPFEYRMDRLGRSVTLDGDVRSAQVVVVSVNDEDGKRFHPYHSPRVEKRAG